ncbi:MAG TPA: zf-HC2 domain-containing protein [Candidatus Angelobacter sp.]|jgi:hypothetical protein
MNSKVIDHQQAIKSMMAERYLLGELSESDRDAYEAHLFDCQMCFEQVKAGTQFVNYLKQTGAEEAAAVPQHRWYQSFAHWFQPKPALVFASLLVFAGGLNVYQGLLLQRANAPEIVVVQTLHPDARGDGNTVIASGRGTFELRVVFQPSPAYKINRVQILNAAGKEVASTPVTNLQGNEVQIRLSARAFQTGKYNLLLQATEPATTNETTIKEYPFELKLQD